MEHPQSEFADSFHLKSHSFSGILFMSAWPNLSVWLSPPWPDAEARRMGQKVIRRQARQSKQLAVGTWLPFCVCKWPCLSTTARYPFCGLMWTSYSAQGQRADGGKQRRDDRSGLKAPPAVSALRISILARFVDQEGRAWIKPRKFRSTMKKAALLVGISFWYLLVPISGSTVCKVDVTSHDKILTSMKLIKINISLADKFGYETGEKLVQLFD